MLWQILLTIALLSVLGVIYALLGMDRKRRTWYDYFGGICCLIFIFNFFAFLIMSVWGLGDYQVI